MNNIQESNTINENISNISENETSILSIKTIKNTKEELDNVPIIIQNYLRDNNVAIVTFNNIESWQIVRCAYLKKHEGKSKDFDFQFNENQLYYIFITKEENPNYLKPQKEKTSKIIFKSKQDKYLENEKKEINLNFHYNKYLLKLVVLKIPNTEKVKTSVLKIDILLDREICKVSHTTLETIEYYKKIKIRNEKRKKQFDQFNLMLEKYYILEVESKKPINEILIKENGILSMLYIMTPSKKITIKLYTMISYSLYFIKETLYNYIRKYIHDMIYDFCHLPSDYFIDFLSHIGCLTHGKGNNYNLVFPLKKCAKTFDSISQKNLIHHMFRNLINIVQPKASERIPYHGFISMLEKYKNYHSTLEFKIKQKYLNGSKAKNYHFLKPALIINPNGDKFLKDHKINLNKVIETLFEILEKYFDEHFTKDKTIARNFMIKNLSKFLTQYTSLKGFFNIDIVMNEIDFGFTNNKKHNKMINKNILGYALGLLGCINYIFGFNEGVFHKHFSIMEYSYNFNEKNVIHIFLSTNDASTKNKFRIFDIPFMEKWNYQVAGLLLYLYREMFGFLGNQNNFKNNQDQLNNRHKDFAKLFDEICTNISDDFFFYYEDVLPNYYKFCKSISNSPLSKYNNLDNICQNFANNSIRTLIKRNVIFFNPFEVLYKINKKNMLNYPNLNSILEPYLIMVDERYKIYLNKKEKQDQYLKEINMDIKTFYEVIKNINAEKVHYSIFMEKDKKIKEKGKMEIENNEEDEFDDINEEVINNNEINTNKNKNKSVKIESINGCKESNISELNDFDISSIKKFEKVILKPVLEEKISKELFDYYFLLNLYYYYEYITRKELKDIFSNYEIIKKYIIHIETSMIMSFEDKNRTVIKTAKEQNLDVKEIKKKQKKGLIKNLMILNKLKKLTSRMNYIFCNYVNAVIEDIIKDKESNIAYRNQLGEKHFLKIGHYMIDFLAYEKKGINYNSFHFFLTSDIYRKLFENNNLNIINTAYNI